MFPVLGPTETPVCWDPAMLKMVVVLHGPRGKLGSAAAGVAACGVGAVVDVAGGVVVDVVGAGGSVAGGWTGAGGAA